jgi:hypothetical protein
VAGDRPLCRLIGERARVTACAQDWDSVITRFEGVLEQVIAAQADPLTIKGALPAPG